MDWQEIETAFKKQHGLNDSELFQWLVSNFDPPTPKQRFKPDKEFVLWHYPDVDIVTDRLINIFFDYACMRTADGTFLGGGDTDSEAWADARHNIENQLKQNQ